MVLRFEEAETPPALRDVVDVARHRVDELVHVVDQSRKEQGADRNNRCENEQTCDAGCEPPTTHPATLKQLDKRIDRHREEDGDQDPDDHVPGDRNDAKQRPDADDQPKNSQDRADAEMDDALRQRGKDRVRVGRSSTFAAS